MIHTTIPIHEIHENEPKHHAASALPAVSLADFKKQGGTLTGREERYDGFEGEPKAIGGALGASNHHHHAGTSGPHSSNVENKLDPRVDSDRDGSRNLGATTGDYGTNRAGTGNYGGVGNPNTTDSGYGSGATGSSYSPNAPAKKAGFLDRLNPLKDTDGDGKRGVGE